MQEWRFEEARRALEMLLHNATRLLDDKKDTGTDVGDEPLAGKTDNNPGSSANQQEFSDIDIKTG